MASASVSLDRYISYNENVRLHLRPDGAYLGTEKTTPLPKGSLLMLGRSEDEKLTTSTFMNRTARMIAERMTGRNTVSDIVREVLHAANASEEHAESIRKFMDKEVAKGVAAFHTEPTQMRHRLTGSTQHFYPNALTVELTHRCNCRCMHCYLEAGNDAPQDEEMTGEDFIRIFAKLIDMGVESFEITGGEAMMHPDFWRIVEYIASRNIFWSLLSNGSLITREAVDRLNTLKVRAVQVSVDGPNAQVHDYFRALPGSFEAACRGIRLFAERTNIPVRMATSVWVGNYHMMNEMVAMARELGADSFASGLLTRNGRAFADGKRLTIDEREFWIYKESMVKMIQIHGLDYMNNMRPQSAARKLSAYVGHCGAGSSTLTLSPNADIRPCVMSPAELIFGNLKKESCEEVFSRNTRFAQIPQPNEDDCSQCPSRPGCPPCVIKGLEVHCRTRVKGFDACKWAKIHRISDILEQLGWDMQPFAAGGCSSCGSQDITL